MFDKFKQASQLIKMRNEAVRIQKELGAEQMEINENGVRLVIAGDQKIKTLEIDGEDYTRAVDVINKAIKKSQEMAAKKLQQMSGGLTGLLGGFKQ